MSKTIIHSDQAPSAIGAYSQAVRAGDTVYLSGQIPLDPATMEVVGGGDFRAEAHQVLKSACRGGGCRRFAGRCGQVECLSDGLGNFAVFNEVMAEYSLSVPCACGGRRGRFAEGRSGGSRGGFGIDA